MIQCNCNSVDYDWTDVSNPDDLVLTVELDRTKHELYPSLREVVLLYDVVSNAREAEFTIGTADYVSISVPEPDLITVDLPPLKFTTDQAEFESELLDVLETAFTLKDSESSTAERERGLEIVQDFIDKQDGTTDIADIYELIQQNNQA